MMTMNKLKTIGIVPLPVQSEDGNGVLAVAMIRWDRTTLVKFNIDDGREICGAFTLRPGFTHGDAVTIARNNARSRLTRLRNDQSKPVDR